MTVPAAGGITPRDEYFHERNDRLGATDNLGRELVAEGRATNMMIWPCYPTVHAWFTHFEWEFDGQQASGEEQEWVPINQRRRFLRRCRHG